VGAVARLPDGQAKCQARVSVVLGRPTIPWGPPAADRGPEARRVAPDPWFF
jgi:hypothetical protein